jgi:copper resistance protein B
MKCVALLPTALLTFWSVAALAQDSDHAGHQTAQTPLEDSTAEIGNAAAPPVPTDHAADRIFPVDRMAKARKGLKNEGRFRTATVMLDRLEYRMVRGRDGYAWEGEIWAGGDIDRFVFASEGEGAFGRRAESAEIRAMWRHAIDPWFNLEAGVRHDIRPNPHRSYAAVGIEGLAPYWFEVEGQLLVSNKGDLHARFEGYHDIRLTQRLVAQPAIETNLAFQDVPELGIGSGLSDIELGLRMRYEFAREFSPYIGVNWERKFGDTARFARAEGDKPSATSLVMGIRFWF